MLFIVTCEPKKRMREGYVLKVSIVEAKTKREALALTARDFEPEPKIFNKPCVAPLTLNHCYRL